MTTRRLDYSQAAARLGIKVSTLRSMVSRKQVPHIRLNAATVIFDADALEAWLPQRDERIERTMQADLDETKSGRDLYAVFCSVTRLCKIGRSNDARRRLVGLQIGSPTPLVMWCHAPFLGKLEPRIHRAFREMRMHGEWFGPSLTERIAREVPCGDVEAFAQFAHDAAVIGARRLNADKRAAGIDKRSTFEWRGKRRPK